jgi:hypothetical protein
MGIKFKPKCYFYTLSAAERAEVHTIDGRRKLEVGIETNYLSTFLLLSTGLKHMLLDY